MIMQTAAFQSFRSADSAQLMPPKAILFDFDGVIADTGNHHIAAWQRTLAVMGWQIADEVAARSAEIDDREFLAELFAERGINGRQDRRLGSPQAGAHRSTAQGCSPALSGCRRSGPKGSGTSSPGRRLGHLAREHRGRLGRRGPGGLVRFDRRQRRRDGGQAGPGRLSTCAQTAPARGQVDGRPRRFAQPVWRPPARPEFAPSPLAIAAPSANGSATPPTSRVSNRPTGCCSIWDCKMCGPNVPARPARIQAFPHLSAFDRVGGRTYSPRCWFFGPDCCLEKLDVSSLYNFLESRLAGRKSPGGIGWPFARLILGASLS